MSNKSAPAFPHPYYQSVGLTKRELFAAFAMQGICSNPNFVRVTEVKGFDDAETLRDVVSGWSLIFAEALIEELEADK